MTVHPLPIPGDDPFDEDPPPPDDTHAPEPGDGPPQRPSVQVNARPLRYITADLTGHLVDANDPPVVYVRGGALTRVRRDEKGQPLVEPMSEPHLRNRLAAVVDTVRVTQQAGRTHVPPPLDIVRDILATPSWAVPALEAITEIPTLRPDGTIHAEPGYDPITRLLHEPAPGLTVPQVPADPAGGEIAAALDLVDELLCDFPFDGDADRANAIACLITPLVRPAIPGLVPFALMDAPEPGTGKGLLADVVCAIATGRPAAKKPLPDREEEIRKMVTSTLMEGSTVVVLDNVDDAIRSPALAAVLTADIWADRILGRSEIVKIPNRATWIATGNNLQVAGDLARRCYRIRLDAHQAKPYTRTGFRHDDLVGWALDHRGELIAALLTLCRAWWAAGRPAGPEVTIGGYTPWARTLGGILAHAGVTDFLGNLLVFLEQADQEAGEWEAWFTAWAGRFEDRIVTVTDVALELECVGTVPLRDMLPGSLAKALGRPTFKQVLGQALTRRKGRHYGDAGWHLVDHPKDRRNVARWSVVGRNGESPTLLDDNVSDLSDKTEKARGMQGLAGSPLPLPHVKTQIHPTLGHNSSRTSSHPAPDLNDDDLEEEQWEEPF